MREKEAEHGRGTVEEKEEADSGLQNEGGGKKTQGFLPPTPPHPTATVAMEKQWLF